jgi:hypothetical protein
MASETGDSQSAFASLIRRFAFDSAVSCHSAANYTPLSDKKAGPEARGEKHRASLPLKTYRPLYPSFPNKMCNFEQSRHGGSMYSDLCAS